MQKHHVYFSLLIISWFVLAIGYLPFPSHELKVVFLAISGYLCLSFLEQQKDPRFKNFHSYSIGLGIIITGIALSIVALLICNVNSYGFESLSSDKKQYELVRDLPTISFVFMSVGLLIIAGIFVGAKPVSLKQD